jgi:hypothetical protein
VTAVFSRRVRPGGEAAYEAWLAGLHEATRPFPGYLGVHVLRPEGGGGRTYVSLLRFESFAALGAWEHSDDRQAWLARFPAGVVEGDAEVRRVEGLEYWYTPRGAPTAVQPIRWRAALVTTVVVFGLILALGPLERALGRVLPFPVPLLVVVALQVMALTYAIMPALTRLLGPWLFPAARQLTRRGA